MFVVLIPKEGLARSTQVFFWYDTNYKIVLCIVVVIPTEGLAGLVRPKPSSVTITKTGHDCQGYGYLKGSVRQIENCMTLHACIAICPSNLNRLLVSTTDTTARFNNTPLYGFTPL